ncbi:MAG: methylthioribose-phosphate isomerase [Methylobacteriaceae bacterium]|jgi:methylthioribose-1-phosphate isomerase|nr:methylthioribose-phosphate isomerase [Methylobacteriaceae bacterium]
MKVDGKPFRTIWREAQSGNVAIIDQTKLPHDFVVAELRDVEDAWRAIADMQVRGAPLIGVAAAYGLALAMRADPSDANLTNAADYLATARPTAINLAWALADMRGGLAPLPPSQRAERAFARAAELADADVAVNEAIGMHGLAMLRELAARKNGRLNILTHCNAGWLATVDWGTATAPIYKGHESGFDLHVFVDETRPRNQGAALTAWELAHHGVPHTLIADNAGGHLMQHGEIDLVIVGTDRTTAAGDVCNKIGTYLKALAAHDNGVPFYVAAPSSSIDFAIYDGGDVPIEMRGEKEVTHMTGATSDGRIETVRVAPEGSPALNPAFDVTPARLVTGLITERGVVAANADALARAFPERVRAAA